MGSSRTGHPSRQQGLQTPPQTQQRRQDEPRGEGLAHAQRELQHLLHDRNTPHGVEIRLLRCAAPLSRMPYGRWSEYQAADKTALRNVIYGRIDNIVELQNGNRQ